MRKQKCGSTLTLHDSFPNPYSNTAQSMLRARPVAMVSPAQWLRNTRLSLAGQILILGKGWGMME